MHLQCSKTIDVVVERRSFYPKICRNSRERQRVKAFRIRNHSRRINNGIDIETCAWHLGKPLAEEAYDGWPALLRHLRLWIVACALH